MNRQTEREYRDALDELQFSNEAKERMMNNLMETKKQDGRNKRIPVRAILLAAALAVGCVLSIAAGLPAQVYNFVSGGSMTSMPEQIGSIGGGELVLPNEQDYPLVLENGRLIFVNGEERTDITDLVSENTPYIYEHTDPVTGNKGYVVMGGTPEDFGWVEYVSLPDGSSGMIGNNFGQDYVELAGERLSLSDLTEEQVTRLNQEGGSAYKTEYRPWLLAAMDQLGLVGF